MSNSKKDKRRENNVFLKNHGPREPLSSNILDPLDSNNSPPHSHRDHHQKNHKANPGILGWIVDPLRGLFSPLTAILQRTLKGLTSKGAFEGIEKDIKPTQINARASLFKLVSPHTPITPAEAGSLAVGFILESESAWSRLFSDTAGVEILGGGIVDMPAALLKDHPSTRAQLSIGTKLYEIMFEQSISPALQRYYLKLHQPNIPGYGDMISVYMREGYLADKWVEIPSEFVEFIKELGFSEFWAYRLWGKHWVLPSVGHLYEMFHKKIIDYNTMAGMLKYHDFEPVWRHRLIENAYQMIPRVDLRRGYVWGLISEAELQERYEKLGYGPGDAAIMKNIAKRFGLSAYYSRLLTVACQAFRRGQLEGPAFQEILEDIGLPEDAQDLILEAEMLAREIGAVEPGEEPRTLTASQVCATYTKGFLSLSAAKKRLLDLGYLEDDADLLLALATPKPEAEAPATEIVSAASLLYREGWMDPAEYAGWLRKARLSEEEIAVVKDAQDLRYRLDYARELLALSKEEYRKDIITLDDFYIYLLRFGCQPERAAAIVALEEARKIPKPRLGA